MNSPFEIPINNFTDFLFISQVKRGLWII